MNWDVTYDGSDYESCDSNSDFLVEENNVVSLMVRLAEYGETVVPKDLVRRKGDVSGVLNETITVTEKRLKNIKSDFLEFSQKESNAAEGIWKCGKVPSSGNLLNKKAVFVIKKCPKKGKNDTTELVVRKCIRNKKEASKGLVDGNKCSETSSDKQEENNMQCIWKCIWKDPSSNVFQEGKGRYRDFKVLETLTKKVLPFFKARKCNSCEISKIRVNDLVKCLDFKKEDFKKKDKEYRYLTRRLYDVLNVFKGINYNKSGNQVSVEGHDRSKNGRKAKSLAAIANKIFMKIKNMKENDILELDNKWINKDLKTKRRRVYDVMEVLTGLEILKKSGEYKNCYIIKRTKV